MSFVVDPLPVRILHLDGSEEASRSVQEALQAGAVDAQLQRVGSADDATARLRAGRFDLVLIGPQPDATALAACWRAISARCSNQAPCIALHQPGVDLDVAALLRMGLSDCLRTDRLADLPTVLSQVLEHWRERRQQQQDTSEMSRAMRRAAELSDLLQLRIEEERQAIAREVHDDIGGSLAAVKFDLAWIARHSQDTRIQAHVQTALELLDHAIEASQRIILDLRPPLLDQGLVSAIDWLGRNFSNRTGVEVAFHSSHETLSLPDTIQLVVYRTAQEALTNITKYAQCQQAAIDLNFTDQVIVLKVSDNGAGLAEGALDKPRAFGIKGLTERAESVGGELRVDSAPGEGTALTLTIPMRRWLQPRAKPSRLRALTVDLDDDGESDEGATA